MATNATHRQKMEVLKLVRKVSSDQLKKPDTEVVLDANYIDDLRADSLDLVDLMVSLEEEVEVQLKCKMEIPDDDAENIRTVRDAVNYILEKVYPA